MPSFFFYNPEKVMQPGHYENGYKNDSLTNINKTFRIPVLNPIVKAWENSVLDKFIIRHRTLVFLHNISDEILSRNYVEVFTK